MPQVYCQHCNQWVNEIEHRQHNQNHWLFAKPPDIEADLRSEEEIKHNEQIQEDEAILNED